MNNLKKIRDTLGVSQNELAASIGQTQGNISHYEMDRQDIPPSVASEVIKFAKTRGHALSFDDIYKPRVKHAA